MTTQSISDAPTADWIDPMAMFTDPYPIYRRLLKEAPVAWVPAVNQFFVTSYRACRAIEEDQDTFSAGVTTGTGTMTRAFADKPMVNKDDPEHAGERRLINPCMRPKSLRERWAPVFERNARKYLDRLREVGPETADLNRDFAAPVSAQNLIDLMGFKDVETSEMQHWSNTLVAGVGNVLDDPAVWTQSDDVRREIQSRLAELVPHYQMHPDESMISAFVNGNLPSSLLTANVCLVITGATNEPQHTVTNAVWALSGHPEQRDQVLADSSLWPAVFDETLRWLSPIGTFPRMTTRETVLEGVKLPVDAPICVTVAAANRDPAEFERPDEFDINRPRRPHLAFGSGVHMCAGHWAARMAIGEIAIPLLYTELPGLRSDPRRQETWFGWVFRGLTEYPVTWD